MILDIYYGKSYSGNENIRFNMGVGLPNAPVGERKAEDVVNAHVSGDHRDGTFPNFSRYPRNLNFFPLNN